METLDTKNKGEIATSKLTSSVNSVLEFAERIKAKQIDRQADYGNDAAEIEEISRQLDIFAERLREIVK